MSDNVSYIVEYERWWDDLSQTTCTVGPFSSRTEAEVWASTAWEPLYDPQWRIRQVHGPWEGRMCYDGHIDVRDGARVR